MKVFNINTCTEFSIEKFPLPVKIIGKLSFFSIEKISLQYMDFSRFSLFTDESCLPCQKIAENILVPDVFSPIN